MLCDGIAEVQVARLDATRDYHMKTAEAIKELVECLRINAEDEHEAKAVIDLWLTHEPFCPTPAEVRATLREVREGKPQPAAQRNAFAFHSPCALCHGTGRFVVYQLCTPTDREVLVQDLSSWQEADAIRERWKAERAAWCAANPTGYLKPPNRAYIGQAGRKCGCGR